MPAVMLIGLKIKSVASFFALIKVRILIKGLKIIIIMNLYV